jgi:PAS domain S-box-containing protein
LFQGWGDGCGGENIPESLSSSFLSYICEKFPDALCIVDISLSIKIANSKFFSLFQTNLIQVLNKPLDSAFSWSEDPDRITSAARQVLSREVNYAEIEDVPYRSGNGTTWLFFTITPIKTDSDKEITGLLITAVDTTSQRIKLSEQAHYSSLINITQKVMSLARISPYNEHPGRLIQLAVSRLGPVLQVKYVSFLEFIENQGKISSISEVPLWSIQYGFLIGESREVNSSEEERKIKDLLFSLSGNRYRIFKHHTSPEIFKRMMIDRDVTDILVLPVLSEVRDPNIYGSLILWDTSRLWSDDDISALLTITDCIGIHLNKIRIESDLKRSEEKFKGVIEYIGDMYYLTDKSGYLLEISPSMIVALGYNSSEELIGNSMQDLLRDPDVWPLFLSDVLTENGVKDYELIFKGKQGKVITGSVSCRLVYTEEGNLRGIEGVIRDISRRKQYEQMIQESEWKLEHAQKIAKIGLWSYDSSTRIFRVSAEIFSILVIPADTSGITLDDLIRMTDQTDKPKFLQYFTLMVREGNEFEFEFRLDLPIEKFKYIRIKGQPRIRNGEITGSFGILQDITERKDVEQHLLKYANQLEQKTFELDAMRTQLLDINRELEQRVRMRTQQIEELLSQKDDFIMQIGHDLKTPLTPLVAILPYVRKKESDPELCELLDVSIRDVNIIRKIIATILELAQMNALYTISDIKRITLRTAIDQIISDNAYLIHQKSLHVINEIPDTCSVMISPMHLETLISNIMNNAVKYSYIDGEILLSGYENSDSVFIMIQDQGVGIEPEVISRIFDAFYCADQSRHDRDSHGLGLAIAKRVADMYGGSIRVESAGRGKGSTFTLQLKKNPGIRNQ